VADAVAKTLDYKCELATLARFALSKTENKEDCQQMCFRALSLSALRKSIEVDRPEFRIPVTVIAVFLCKYQDHEHG